MHDIDGQALKELYAVASRMLGRFGTPDVAEDVVQEALLEFLAKNGNVLGKETPDMLLLEVLKTASARFKKRKQRDIRRTVSLNTPLNQHGSGKAICLEDSIPTPTTSSEDDGIFLAEIMEDISRTINKFQQNGTIKSLAKVKAEILKRIIEEFLLMDEKSFNSASKTIRIEDSPLSRTEAAELWQAIREVIKIRHAYLNRKMPTRIDGPRRKIV